jgi:hypothetical protein
LGFLAKRLQIEECILQFASLCQPRFK